MIQAVVFDFDGTLVTTEEAEFASWSQLYQEHGAELVLDEWVKCVGQPAGTWSAFDHLCDLTGTSHDSEAVHERRLALLEAELESLGVGRVFGPGASTDEVVAYLREAVAHRSAQRS